MLFCKGNRLSGISERIIKRLPSGIVGQPFNPYHVELVQHTINQLFTGSGEEAPGKGGANGAPLQEAINHVNPHHFIIGAQSFLPVDAAGNPWNGSYVYSNGNLISHLLANPAFESIGVLQKSRIYEMSANKTFRETQAFLIVRDNAHQNAFAKALETLGVDWGIFSGKRQAVTAAP